MEWFFLLLRDNSSSSPPGNMMMRWWSSSVGQLQRDTEQGDGFCWSFDSCNINFVIVNRFVMVICTTPPLLSSWTQHICAWARDLPLVCWARGTDRRNGRRTAEEWNISVSPKRSPPKSFKFFRGHHVFVQSHGPWSKMMIVCLVCVTSRGTGKFQSGLQCKSESGQLF